jgi:hypothetical protein
MLVKRAQPLGVPQQPTLDFNYIPHVTVDLNVQLLRQSHRTVHRCMVDADVVGGDRGPPLTCERP